MSHSFVALLGSWRYETDVSLLIVEIKIVWLQIKIGVNPWKLKGNDKKIHIKELYLYKKLLLQG